MPTSDRTTLRYASRSTRDNEDNAHKITSNRVSGECVTSAGVPLTIHDGRSPSRSPSNGVTGNIGSEAC